MLLVLRYTLAALRAVVRERRELALENIALRHQVEVLARGRPRERQAQSLREQASVSSRCAVSVARRHPWRRYLHDTSRTRLRYPGDTGSGSRARF